jgi:hypothetical protein
MARDAHAAAQQWRGYKKLQMLHGAAFLLFLVSMVLGFGEFFEPTKSAALEVFDRKLPFGCALLFGGTIGWTEFKLAFWPCPQCGKPLHGFWGYHNLLNRNWKHCGLEKWADPTGAG